MPEEYQILHEWIQEGDIDPIDFICKQCSHSSEEHDNNGCKKGLISKCDCEHFVLNEKQIQDVKDELNEIGEILLKNFKEAKKLHDGTH